ncbi:hypothetical protein GDO81_012256 [Engystomops pustulosus]|uniref:Uncharacterized protein n=1 Tax=Engystomops pustulosus TaxID=76066 RepID=A0AAV7BK75_ENGPU|nr:hypothetical protein GDO81_012256 [Engystomops pustulosus]
MRLSHRCCGDIYGAQPQYGAHTHLPPIRGQERDRRMLDLFPGLSVAMLPPPPLVQTSPRQCARGKAGPNVVCGIVHGNIWGFVNMYL